MEKKRKNKIVIIVLLLVLCICAFFALTVAVKRIEKAMYPIKYEELVEKYSQEYNISPLIIYTLIRTESGFKPLARSGAGAIGLTQITEETFDWIKSKIAREEALEFEALLEPENAIRFGAYFFSQCLLRYNNDISTAAAAYHSGWGTVDKLLANAEYASSKKTLNEFPYEQMGLYVKKINKSYACYKKLYGNIKGE